MVLAKAFTSTHEADKSGPVSRMAALISAIVSIIVALWWQRVEYQYHRLLREKATADLPLSDNLTRGELIDPRRVSSNWLRSWEWIPLLFEKQTGPELQGARRRAFLGFFPTLAVTFLEMPLAFLIAALIQ